MKTIKYLTATLLFCVAMATAQKQVDFIHGLNGNWTTWNYYNDLDYKYYSANFRNIDYKSKGTINTIADKIYKDNNYKNKSSRIGVGHSMGGLLIKQLVKNDANAYGGFITIGTPHAGARIANALDNGRAKDFFKRTKNKIMTPVTLGFWLTTLDLIDLSKWSFSPAWLYNFKDFFNILGAGFSGLGALVTGAFYIVGDVLIDVFLPIIINKFAGAGGLRNDLKENSALTNSLTDIRSITGKYNIPMIAIYGEERDRAMYRLIAGKTNENEMLGTFTSITNVYFAISTVCYTNATINAVVAGYNFWNPWAWYYAAKAAAGYYVGYRFNDSGHYLKNDIHSDWSTLIGAYRTEERSYTYVEWDCPKQEYRGRDDHWSNDYRTNDDIYFNGPCYRGQRRKVTVSWTVYIRESSDGLLHKTTQTALPGALKLDAQGANHLEQTKHPNVKERLEQIFNGDIPEIRLSKWQKKKYEYFKLKK